MIAPPRPLFARASGTAAALGFLGLIALALPHSAHAQTGPPVDDATSVPMPTTILHLRPEAAAPTREVLHERLLTGLKIRGAALAPKEGEPSVLRFSPRAPEHPLTNTHRNEVQKRYLAGRPTLIEKKQAVERLQASDSLILAKVAKKSQIDPGILRIVVASGGPIVNTNLPLFATLSMNQPADPSGRVYLTFISPKEYNSKKDRVTFQNESNPFEPPSASPSDGILGPDFQKKLADELAEAEEIGDALSGKSPPLPTVFNPTSYLHVELKAKAGVMYLVSLKAYWGTSPYDPNSDTVNIDHAVLVLCGDPDLSGVADDTQLKAFDIIGHVKTIPGGTGATPMFLRCDKDGWYEITVVGLTNPWDFRGITIKEITF